MTCIYKILSPSGKIYIGQSRNFRKRLQVYRTLWCKGQAKLYSSFKSYGVEKHTFSVIIILPIDILQIELDAYEQLYMDFYRHRGFQLLNLKESGFKKYYSEESKAKMPRFKKDAPPWNKGLKTPERVKKAQSKAAKKRLKIYGRAGLDQSGKIPWNKGLKSHE